MPTPGESFPKLTLAELIDPSRAVQAAIEVYGTDARRPLSRTAHWRRTSPVGDRTIAFGARSSGT